MNTLITTRKLAVIIAGLVLTVSASVGHAQQKVAERMLEQTLQEQQLAEQTESDRKEAETASETEKPEKDLPEDIDVSNTYGDEGDPII